MNTQNRTWMKVWGVLLTVFALGCATGVGISGVLRSQPSASNLPTSIHNDAYFNTLKKELDLNGEQAAAMHKILEATRTDYRAICAEVRPRYDTLRERTRGQMRALLSPEQQQKFDTLVLQEDCSTCPDRRR